MTMAADAPEATSGLPGNARGAIIEILERHLPDNPTADDGAQILVPNLLRINGAEIWGPADHPVVIGPLSLKLGSDLVDVTVQMLARLIKPGDERGDLPMDADPNAPKVPIVEIGDGDPPVITLNGTPLALAEPDEGCPPVRVLYEYGPRYARIELAIIARRVVFDAEANSHGVPGGHLYYPIPGIEWVMPVVRLPDDDTAEGAAQSRTVYALGRDVDTIRRELGLARDLEARSAKRNAQIIASLERRLDRAERTYRDAGGPEPAYVTAFGASAPTPIGEVDWARPVASEPERTPPDWLTGCVYWQPPIHSDSPTT
jgi:hypothetical protein